MLANIQSIKIPLSLEHEIEKAAKKTNRIYFKAALNALELGLSIVEIKDIEISYDPCAKGNTLNLPENLQERVRQKSLSIGLSAHDVAFLSLVYGLERINGTLWAAEKRTRKIPTPRPPRKKEEVEEEEETGFPMPPPLPKSSSPPPKPYIPVYGKIGISRELGLAERKHSLSHMFVCSVCKSTVEVHEGELTRIVQASKATGIKPRCEAHGGNEEMLHKVC